MDGSVAPARMPKSAKERGKVAPAKLAHVVLKTPPERVKLVLDWYKTVLEAEAMFETDLITSGAFGSMNPTTKSCMRVLPTVTAS